MPIRELDDALGLTHIAADYLQESRSGRNIRHHLVPLLRQSIYSRLAVIAWHCEQRVGFSSLSDADQQATAGHTVKARPGGGYTWKMDPAVRTDTRRPDPEASWSLARRIPGPVLLIRGGTSDLLSPEIAQRMVAEMQDCRMVEVPGVGHAPTLTEPEAFGPVMEFFSLA